MKLLDLFCCAGGAGMGYHRVGFEVVGVDIKLQPKYPFTFFQGDAVDYLKQHGHEFDAIHASPPCQCHSKAKPLAGDNHGNFIEATREQLRKVGKPYIIENVPGAPLINPVVLNGFMFGLQVNRERLFECSFPMPFMLKPQSAQRQVKMGRPVREGEIIQVVGHFSNVPYARNAMGIDWMGQKELSQAIPPAYTEFIGRELMKVLKKQLQETK